jgi:hypothetical protein
MVKKMGVCVAILVFAAVLLSARCAPFDKACQATVRNAADVKASIASSESYARSAQATAHAEVMQAQTSAEKVAQVEASARLLATLATIAAVGQSNTAVAVAGMFIAGMVVLALFLAYLISRD